MALTFVAGSAADAFPPALDDELRRRFPAIARDAWRYGSEPLDPRGWRALQARVLKTLDYAPQLTGIDAYQAVYVPGVREGVEHLPIANVADPLQVGSLEHLLEELQRFAVAASLPTDDLELMRLAAHYLEGEDADADLDVQTFVQLLLSAKQAAAHAQPLWIAV